MRVLIVDDEQPARDRLKNLIKDIPHVEVAGEAADGAAALQMLAEDPVDVVLLDIRMPGMDGLETARHAVNLDPPPAVILVTAYGDHALEAFGAHAVDYLLKPVRRERLAEALVGASRTNRAQLTALQEAEGARTRICARKGNSIETVSVDDVYYFLADRKYVTVRHAAGELLIEESLRALDEEFAERFLRIHRNALVAVAHAAGLQRVPAGRPVVWFRDIDDTLEVSRRHMADVRRTLLRGS